MSRTFEPVSALARNQTLTVPSLAERQARQRRLAYCLAFIRARDVPEASYESANVWDISEQSIGLFLDHPFALGQSLDLSFRYLAFRDRVATVVHITELDAGWHIDCKLSNPFSVMELRALGAFEM